MTQVELVVKETEVHQDSVDLLELAVKEKEVYRDDEVTQDHVDSMELVIQGKEAHQGTVAPLASASAMRDNAGQLSWIIAGIQQ